MLKIDLTGKVAFITGGSRGIGRACAETLADCGATVVVNYNKNSALADEIVQKIGNNSIALKGNVANPDEVKDMLNHIFNTYGRLDILVNNAGTTSEGSLEELTVEEIDHVLKVNLAGPFYCCKYALPYLKSNGGSIINISSTSMFTGGGGGAHYAGSKAGLLGLTRNISKEYGKYNVRANALAITMVKTELLASRKQGDLDKKIEGIPLKRLCEPREVANLVAFLSSDLATYISGEVITVDGGRTFA